LLKLYGLTPCSVGRAVQSTVNAPGALYRGLARSSLNLRTTTKAYKFMSDTVEDLITRPSNGDSQAVRRKRHPLIGKHFHRIENDILTWQGRILAVTDDCALVQLYSWLFGEDSTQHLLPLKMFEWRENPVNGFLFYDDDEAMKYAYEYGGARCYRASLKDEEAGKGL
jgi:hypothetical protein